MPRNGAPINSENRECRPGSELQKARKFQSFQSFQTFQTFKKTRLTAETQSAEFGGFLDQEFLSPRPQRLGGESSLLNGLNDWNIWNDWNPRNAVIFASLW
jgi:hypothetical protein